MAVLKIKPYSFNSCLPMMLLNGKNIAVHQSGLQAACTRSSRQYFSSSRNKKLRYLCIRVGRGKGNHPFYVLAAEAGLLRLCT